MKIGLTRAMIHAALSGALDHAPYDRHELFALDVPAACQNVPPQVLNPRSTWADRDAYDRQARQLAQMFMTNFAAFANHVSSEVRAAGPAV